MAAAPYRIMLMDALRQMTRRNVVRGVVASAASPTFFRAAYAQSAARIVVIGGGFCGASCARALPPIVPQMHGTPVRPNRTFISCPFTHQVVTGPPGNSAQQ